MDQERENQERATIRKQQDQIFMKHGWTPIGRDALVAMCIARINLREEEVRKEMESKILEIVHREMNRPKLRMIYLTNVNSIEQTRLGNWNIYYHDGVKYEITNQQLTEFVKDGSFKMTEEMRCN